MFLNEHLIGKHHGEGIAALFINFIEDPPKKKKFKRKLLYGKFAEVELERNRSLGNHLLRIFGTDLTWFTKQSNSRQRSS